MRRERVQKGYRLQPAHRLRHGSRANPGAADQIPPKFDRTMEAEAVQYLFGQEAPLAGGSLHGDNPLPQASHRVSPWGWEKHHDTIRELYLGQSLTQKVVMETMASQHGFHAS